MRTIAELLELAGYSPAPGCAVWSHALHRELTRWMSVEEQFYWHQLRRVETALAASFPLGFIYAKGDCYANIAGPKSFIFRDRELAKDDGHLVPIDYTGGEPDTTRRERKTLWEKTGERVIRRGRQR